MDAVRFGKYPTQHHGYADSPQVTAGDVELWRYGAIHDRRKQKSFELRNELETTSASLTLFQLSYQSVRWKHPVNDPIGRGGKNAR